MITIDGITYTVPVIALKMNGDFLDKSAERTGDGNLERQLIGVFFNYKLELGAARTTQEFAALWEVLSRPVEYHEVTLPDESGVFTFTAYIANLTADLLKFKDGVPYWNHMTVDFVAKRPARTPA